MHPNPVSAALFCHLCARLCSASTTSVTSLKCITSYHTTVASFIMVRNCLNQSDSFCYVCGEVIFISQRKTFIPMIKKCYELYFGCNVGDEEKSWTPHICCATCVRILNGSKNCSRHIPVAVPVSGHSKDHSSDCYFCLTDISGISSKSKYTVTYPNLPSAM